jgi:hypothetical protein
MPALTLDRPAVADSSVDRSATITAAVTMAIGLPTAPTTGPMATIGPITATATGPTVIMVMGVAGATRRIAHNARPSEVQEQSYRGLNRSRWRLVLSKLIEFENADAGKVPSVTPPEALAPLSRDVPLPNGNVAPTPLARAIGFKKVS